MAESRLMSLSSLATHVSWRQIHSNWSRTLTEHGVVPTQLFAEVELDQRPEVWWNGEVNDTQLMFWPPEEISRNARQLQTNIDRAPGMNTIPTYDVGAGSKRTLELLWRHRASSHIVAALLLLASLLARTHRHSRISYPWGSWPSQDEVEILQDIILAVLESHNVEYGWHWSVTSFLPVQVRDHGCKLGTIDDLVSHLANEHCQLLREYRPVAVRSISDLRKTGGTPGLKC